MKIIERNYSQPQRLTPGIDLQSQLNTFAQKIHVVPPRVRIHEKGNNHKQQLSSIPLTHDISPFYSYTLHVLNPVSAELVITPNRRFDSNRYHSIVREDGTIVTRRGRTVYKLGTSTLGEEYEMLGIAVSTPHRGRRKTKEFHLAASLAYSPFGMGESVIFPSSPENDMRGLIEFLETAERHLRRGVVVQ